MEGGIYEHWIQGYDPPSTQAQERVASLEAGKKQGVHPVELEDLQGAFIIALIGYGASIIVAFFELLLNRRNPYCILHRRKLSDLGGLLAV